MSRSISLALIFLLAAPTVGARVATVGDLPSVVELERVEINVSADGRSKMIRETILRINNDQGREAQSVQTLNFNSRAQKFELLEASTLNSHDGREERTPVPRGDIEIKETGELSQAFDSIKQVAISYPKVKIGSRLYLKYTLQNHEIPLEGFWSLGFSLSGEAIEKMHLKVISALPLFHRVNDPSKRLHVEESKSGRRSVITFTSKVPLISVTTQEEMPFLRTDRSLSMWISTLPDWKNYAKDMIPVHEKILAKPLPPVLAMIRDQAAQEKTVRAKIEKVGSLIPNEFRYFGDWRRRKGGYVPRSLAQIADSRYGDCKDMSVISTAIFRSLGFKADIAWIYRGEIPPAAAAYSLPVDTSFNHAITRVEADGQVFWVDGTNSVAFADGVFPDIADRPAYVLAASGGRLERTPALRPEGARDRSHLVYDLQGDGSLNVSGSLWLGGRVAIGLTARSFYSPKETLNYDLIRAISNGGRITSSSVGDFASGSRIVRDLEVPVKFGLSDIGLRTSAGFGFPLMRPDVATRLLVETRDRSSDVYLENPGQSRTEVEVRGVKRIGRESLDCDLKTDFVSLKREVRDISGGVTIADTVEVRSSTVNNETLQSPEFAKFQKSLRDCFNRAAVIFERR